MKIAIQIAQKCPDLHFCLCPLETGFWNIQEALEHDWSVEMRHTSIENLNLFVFLYEKRIVLSFTLEELNYFQ